MSPVHILHLSLPRHPSAIPSAPWHSQPWQLHCQLTGDLASSAGVSVADGTFLFQVFYYTDTKLHPRKWERGYYVTPSSLPPMISSVESKLGKHVSSTLHHIDWIAV